MKNQLQKAIAILMVLALVLGMTAALAGEVVSKPIYVHVTLTPDPIETEPEATETENAPAAAPAATPTDVAEEAAPEQKADEPEAPAATETDVTEPEVTETEATATDVTEPAAEETEPEATATDVAEAAETEATATDIAETEATEEPTAITFQIGAPIREAADGMSAIIANVTEDTVLEIVAVEGNWIHVVGDGIDGYIYAGDASGVETEETDPAATPIVEIFSSRRSAMTLGETVNLTSVLHNADGYLIRYQWQVNKGAGFEDIPGANDPTYSFSASVETLSYDWRLLVYYKAK